MPAAFAYRQKGCIHLAVLPDGCTLCEWSFDEELGTGFNSSLKHTNELLGRVISVRRGSLQGCERICSQHFVDNCHCDDPSDTNYRPALFQH